VNNPFIDPECPLCGGSGVIEYNGQEDHCLCVRTTRARMQEENANNHLTKIIREAVAQGVNEALRTLVDSFEPKTEGDPAD
jgi:hypothetical protein